MFTPVWSEMCKRKDVHFTLFCRKSLFQQLDSLHDSPNISFSGYPKAIFFNDRFLSGLVRKLDDRYIFPSVLYRFFALNNFSHYRIYKNSSPEGRKKRSVMFMYSKGTGVGLPFPRSKWLFRFLYRMRYTGFGLYPRLNGVFPDKKFDLFVISFLQADETVYWTRALRNQNIPAIGILASWDHPTTRGPIPRGMSGYVVASERMRDEVNGLHGIDRERVERIGKVQMDIYKDRSVLMNRADFLEKIGVPSDRKLILLGTNTTGLKEHEVSIARRLAEDIKNERYGKVCLLIRTHPQDKNAERDFISLAEAPYIVSVTASGFGMRAGESAADGYEDVRLLANLMKHSDIVIQSRGSLALDAIAFDTPVISLAFDGDLKPLPEDSFYNEYLFEHYRPLVDAKGTWMVHSFQELDEAIRGYLADPSRHDEGRARIKKEHIEPFDGQASRRLVDYLVESAEKARAGQLPPADWEREGFGDLTWSAREFG